MNNKKSPNPIDRHVGGKVRARRLVLGMTQEKLGNAIGLTFQQVQKYEKGTNRIGASRLQQIAGVLQVPPAFFFEGGPTIGAHGATIIADNPLAVLAQTRDGLALARAFNRIDDGRMRAAIVALAESAAPPLRARKAA